LTKFLRKFPQHPSDIFPLKCKFKKKKEHDEKEEEEGETRQIPGFIGDNFPVNGKLQQQLHT